MSLYDAGQAGNARKTLSAQHAPMIVPVNTQITNLFTAFRACILTCAALVLLPGGAPSAQVTVSTPTVVAATAGTESYRLRFENIQYGRVEVSLDAGKTYLLIGRVTHAAAIFAQEKATDPGGVVLRSSAEGIAFSGPTGQVLKLRPQPPTGARTGPQAKSADKESEIVTSISAQRGLWSKFLAPAGSAVQLQMDGHEPGPFPDGYTMQAGDRYLVTVALPLPAPPIGVGLPPQTEQERKIQYAHALRAQFESMAAEYKETVVSRALAEKRKVVAGTLTLRPGIAPDEPDPVTAVTYAVDELPVCARTTPPYLFAWDTTSVSDGEHVIEVRALSAAGTVITHTRYLVVIKNTKDPVPTQP